MDLSTVNQDQLADVLQASGSSDDASMRSMSQGSGTSGRSLPKGGLGMSQGSSGTANKQKKKDVTNMSLIENVKLRTQRFQRRAATMMDIARELTILTASRISIYMEYKTKRETTVIKFPEDAPAVEGPNVGDTEPGSSGNQFKSAVKEGFKEAFTELNLQGFGTQSHVSDSSTDYSSDSDVSMPSQASASSAFLRLRNRRVANPAACFICNEATNHVPERFQNIESEFVHCPVNPCVGRAHYDCLGVPQLGPKNELAGSWFCNLHIGVARAKVVRSGPAPSTSTGIQAPVDPVPLPASGFMLPGTQKRGKARGRPPLTRVVENVQVEPPMPGRQDLQVSGPSSSRGSRAVSARGSTVASSRGTRSRPR